MIKSGAVIQNRYLNNPYPTNYNPMGRPGNFDVVRPHDSSSVFDTGIPKDVSPYQPRVAVSVEIQPKSVFRPKRMQRQAKQVNGAKWGQTALKSIFGGGENVITNYMAQRLLGLVDGTDNRMTQSMQGVVDGNLMDFRGQPSTTTSSETPRAPSSSSDESMGSGGARPTPGEVADLTDLSLGEMPLSISIPEPSEASTEFNTAQGSPSTQFESAAGSPDVVMEAVAEVETQPAEAAAQGGLLDIVQETAAGIATIRPRNRGFGLGEGGSRPTNFIGDVLN